MSDSETIFSGEEWLRYTRHIQLPQVGAEGQTRLKNSKVLIIGAGGLGSPVSLYLAGAGVGTITIVDHDTVDLTNLQRQIIFTTEQVGKSKAVCAKDRLEALNPEIKVTALVESFNQDNASNLVKQADIVVDCTDNFDARYLINDSCIKHKTPWVFASIHQFSGQCAFFSNKEKQACFRCLFPDYPSQVQDCNTAGVMGVLPGILGTIQANEVIKYITTEKSALDGYLMLAETSDLSFRKIKLSQNHDCKSCGATSNRTKPAAEITESQTRCEQLNTEELEINYKDFELQKNSENLVLIDVRSEAEHKAFNIGGLHITLDQLSSRLEDLAKEHTIICYCQTGQRSLEASRYLSDKNLKALSLKGGLANLLKK